MPKLLFLFLPCLLLSEPGRLPHRPDGNQSPADTIAISRHLLNYRKDSVAGNWQSALIHYQKASEIRKSIDSMSSAGEIAQMEHRYQTAKKEAQITALKNKAKMQQGRLSLSGISRTYTLTIIILLLLICALLYYSHWIKSLNIKRLNMQKNELDRQNGELRTLVGSKIRLLDEKEWLMKELHHRVKNNLQLINSMLSLHKGYLKTDGASLAILDTQNRIRSISLIHQRLYQSGNSGVLNISAFIGELVSHLRSSLSAPESIAFLMDCEDMEFEISRAIPLGLIITEIVTNSIKYAFPIPRKGNVRIILKRPPNTALVQMDISDDGIGLNPGVNLKNARTLGASIIQRFSGELDADLQISTGPGIAYSIRFPL